MICSPDIAGAETWKAPPVRGARARANRRKFGNRIRAIIEKLFTRKDLLHRWRENWDEIISDRTVRRHIKQFKLPITKRRGNTLFYSEPAIVEMENRRKQYFSQMFDDRDGGAAIISVANAKKVARIGVRGRK